MTINQRRFEETIVSDPASVKALPDDHPAVVEHRPLFPTMVVSAQERDLLFAIDYEVAEANARILASDRGIKRYEALTAIYSRLLAPKKSAKAKRHVEASA